MWQRNWISLDMIAIRHELLVMRLKNWREGYLYRKRKQRVLEACGCVCWCPNCNDILNDQADCEDNYEEQKVYYHCNSCENDSVWTFDAAPVPILLEEAV